MKTLTRKLKNSLKQRKGKGKMHDLILGGVLQIPVVIFGLYFFKDDKHGMGMFLTNLLGMYISIYLFTLGIVLILL